MTAEETVGTAFEDSSVDVDDVVVRHRVGVGVFGVDCHDVVERDGEVGDGVGGVDYDSFFHIGMFCFGVGGWFCALTLICQILMIF